MTSKATTRPRRGREERGSGALLWALAASLGIHLLLVLLSVWVPLRSSAAQLTVAPDDETTIRFAFTEPDETEADRASDLPPPPTEPRALPDLVPPGQEAEAAPLPAAAPSVAQPAEAIPPPEPQIEPEARTVEARSPDEPFQISENATSDFLKGAAEAAQDPPEQQPPSSRGIDLNRALRDFRREAARRPPSVPSLPPGGGRPANSFVPDVSLPTTGYGMGNLRFESTDFDWRDYARQIYVLIWKAWHWRLYQTANEFDKWAFQQRGWYLDHSAQIRFVIRRNGDVTDIMVEAASGCAPLDLSAVDALTEVTLPPLPAAFPRQQEVVHARFIATGDIRDLRPSLTYLYQRGIIP